jgi:uncharacterized protein YjiS (DUF1127 family)
MSSQCHESVIGRASARKARAGLVPSLTRMLEWVETLAERYRQRRALSAMDDRLLRDMGLTRADVEQETAKPFWRP